MYKNYSEDYTQYDVHRCRRLRKDAAGLPRLPGMTSQHWNWSCISSSWQLRMQSTATRYLYPYICTPVPVPIPALENVHSLANVGGRQWQHWCAQQFGNAALGACQYADTLYNLQWLDTRMQGCNRPSDSIDGARLLECRRH